MKIVCDDCIQDKTACPKCRARVQARADRQYDELREEGYCTSFEKHIVEEMEERSLYPFGRL